MLDELGSLVPLGWPRVEELYCHDAWDVPDGAPTKRCHHLVSLRLHKQPISLLVELVEGNLRLILVLVL